jgi:hypothetical protein
LWVLSGYQVLPRPGGLDDQDPLWITDMALALRLRAFQRQAYTTNLTQDLTKADARGNGQRAHP